MAYFDFQILIKLLASKRAKMVKESGTVGSAHITPQSRLLSKNMLSPSIFRPTDSSATFVANTAQQGMLYEFISLEITNLWSLLYRLIDPFFYGNLSNISYAFHFSREFPGFSCSEPDYRHQDCASELY